jgi:hypothetical protein
MSENVDYEALSKLHPYEPPAEAEPTPAQISEPWGVEGRTPWESTLRQEEELRSTYPGGKDEFFGRLWDEPSRYDLETFGHLCGVSVEGQSGASSAPDAEASPREVVEGLRVGALSPHLVSAEVVAGVVREIPRDLWLRGDWEDIVYEHGESALELAERVKAIEAHRAENRLRRAIITEDSGVAPSANWLVENMFVTGDLVAVIGRKSAGKSTLAAVDLACCVATGTPWIGRRVKRGRVLVLVAEGTDVEYQTRVRAWRAAHPDAGDPWGNLMPVVERISLVANAEPATSRDHERGDEHDVEYGGTPVAESSRDVQHAVELIAEEEPALVIIDNLVASLDGHTEMSPADITSVLSAMQSMADVAGSTVLMVHDTEYNERKVAGLTQFEDGVSAIAHIKTRTNSTERFVECYKPARLATQWPTVKLRLVPKGDAAVFVPTAASDTDAIHRALDDLGLPSGKNAILQQAKEMGFGLNRNSALRLVDELADDPDDLVAKDGIKYYLEGSLD